MYPILKNRSTLAAFGLAAMLAATSSAGASPTSLATSPRADGAELQLSAEAAATVATDELTVVLAFEQEGQAVAVLNGAVLKQLNDSLALAKKSAGVEARLNSVSTSPVWENNGKRKGWRVRGELILKSGQLATLTELTGKLSETLQLVSATYGVSADLLAKSRASLIAQAAESFKSKAASTAQALGFSSYEMLAINLNDGISASPPMPIAFKAPRGVAMAMSADNMALPAEGGTERITISFSGTVMLKK